MPASVSRTDVTFNADIWSSRLYATQVYQYITAAQYKRLMGEITAGTIVVLKSQSKNVMNRRNLPVLLTLTLQSNVPADGAVQIIFNSNYVRARAHCRSSLTNYPSTTFISSASSISSGSLGCRVQTNSYVVSASNAANDISAGSYSSWVISGFQALTGPVTLYIEGIIDVFMSSSLTTDYFYAYTYASNSEDPIINTGRFIDSYYHYSPNQLSNILTFTKNYDTTDSEKYDFLHISVLPLRASARVKYIIFVKI